MPFRSSNDLRTQRANVPFKKRRLAPRLTHKVQGIRIPVGYQGNAGKKYAHGKRLTKVVRKHEGLFPLQQYTLRLHKVTTRFTREVGLGTIIARGGGTLPARPTSQIGATKNYYLTHRAQMLAEAKSRYIANRAKIIAYEEAQYYSHRGRIIAQHKKYNHSPKGKAAQAKAHSNYKKAGFKPRKKPNA